MPSPHCRAKSDEKKASVMREFRRYSLPGKAIKTDYPKGESGICFEKMHIFVYKVSYCDKGEMKNSKKI